MYHRQSTFCNRGVVSGLGKGITASSIGVLLKARGLKVFMQKLDPYINIDPGTMSHINMVKCLLLMMEQKLILTWGIMRDLLMKI